jgi:hypothetical protein
MQTFVVVKTVQDALTEEEVDSPEYEVWKLRISCTLFAAL